MTCEIKCEMCDNPAYAFCEWGPAPEQKANLCERHSKKVWDEALPLIKTGRLWWAQSPPKGDKSQ
jgi:hypothetical protein